jgi:hypothetical protein
MMDASAARSLKNQRADEPREGVALKDQRFSSGGSSALSLEPTYLFD